MNPQKQAIENDLEQLALDAGTLIAATADMAGEKIGEARKRLACMVDRGREIYDQARGKAVASTKAADGVVHRNLYQAIAFAVGAGVIIGYHCASRCSCKHE